MNNLITVLVLAIRLLTADYTLESYEDFLPFSSAYNIMVADCQINKHTESCYYAAQIEHDMKWVDSTQACNEDSNSAHCGFEE